MAKSLEIKTKIYEKIKAYDTIIIHRHHRPDGDCMGSSFGLRDILLASFPDKNIYSVGGRDKAEYLEFLGKEDQINEEDYQDALVIVVDTANKERISGDDYSLGKEIIKIDHHIETDPYGDINYVRTDYPSTTSLIMDFFISFPDLKMTKVGATALYVGMVTDTGRFRYDGVTGKTLRLAGDLLDYNLDTEEIFSRLYMRERNVLKLEGHVLRKFKTTENGVNYMYISRRLRERFKVKHGDASALVNTMDNVKGSLVWILFLEAKEGIRARIRSRYVNISLIAQEFNGGGHKQASGASVKNKRELKQLVKRADEELAKFKEENGDLI